MRSRSISCCRRSTRSRERRRRSSRCCRDCGTCPRSKRPALPTPASCSGLEDTVGDFVPAGRSLEEMRKEEPKPRLKSVSQGYLEAMGVPLLAGRSFDGRDSATAPPAVILNRTVARRLFGDANPVGATLAWALGCLQGQHRGSGRRRRRRRAAGTRRAAGLCGDLHGLPADRRDRMSAPELHKLAIERLAFGFLAFGVQDARQPRSGDSRRA